MIDEMTMPGDELAAGEEYMSGDGTYEREGTIYSAIIGRRVFDQSSKTVRVEPLSRTIVLRPGDIVWGEVTNVNNSVAGISISGVEDSERLIGKNENGVIHVSRIMDAYTEDARKHYRVGDLVRARVEQVKPSIQLSTKGDDLGVLKARCMRCRNFLGFKNGKLYCGECERDETRKLASDFRKYSPAVE